MNEENANLLIEKLNLLCVINHNFLLLHTKEAELTKHLSLSILRQQAQRYCNVSSAKNW
jgi:hypothetical protein